jgi:hypothetical protein
MVERGLHFGVRASGHLREMTRPTTAVSRRPPATSHEYTMTVSRDGLCIGLQQAPTGLRKLAQGCHATAFSSRGYPGYRRGKEPTPKGLRRAAAAVVVSASCARFPQPLRGRAPVVALPRVAARQKACAQQPWASLRNPVGIQSITYHVQCAPHHVHPHADHIQCGIDHIQSHADQAHCDTNHVQSGAQALNDVEVTPWR